jgi:cellulose biosynthesis protein BcsQ
MFARPFGHQTPGIHVIPANIDLSAAEVHLVNEVAREQILAGVSNPSLTTTTWCSLTANPLLVC